MEKNLHKNRLSFIIKKYTTFIKASEYVLKGTIKDKDIEIFALNDDIKLSINDKTNLYLKDLKLFIDTKMNANDLKENINLYLLTG